MIPKKYALPLVMVTAAGGPYLMLEDGWYDSVAQQVATLTSSDSPGPTSLTGEPSSPPMVAEFRSEYGIGSKAELPGVDATPYITGAPVGEFSEILRFNVSPAWVTSRWPRVTTTLAETGLEGLRVPLVTGTRTDDLAGSLTYYFDPYQQVQRLSLEGYTGDPRRLIDAVAQYYGLRLEPSLGAGMFVGRWNGMPTSVLRISRAPVVSHASPHAQMHVMLELNRPSRTYGLSPHVQTLLQVDRHSGRW